MSDLLFQKYTARGLGEDRSVEVAQQGKSFLTRTPAGDLELRWEDLGEGRALIRFAGKPREVRVRRLHDGSYSIEWRGRILRIPVEDDLAIRARLAHKHHGGLVSLRSPMPGMVLKVLVAEGDTVTGEQPVLIVEAMKMQNELAAPMAGTVVRIAVRQGEPVDAEQLLIEIQP